VDYVNYLKLASDWFLDLIFPIRCLGCSLFGRYVCRSCLNSIPLRQSFECVGCKRRVPFGRTCILCRHDNAVGELFIVANYKDKLVERIIRYYKYRFIGDLSAPLFLLVRKYFKTVIARKNFNPFLDNPVIMPAPLHWRRLNWRGFNQSALLAKALADYFQLEYADPLIRLRTSSPQADIKERDSRLQNVVGLFACRDKKAIDGRSILLVDDVCTTGATLNECAKTLKAAGAVKVAALVVARG